MMIKTEHKILIILLLIFSACKEPLEKNIELPVEGKLLFVEDFSGRDGLLAGRFGDIVLIDSKTQTRYALTDDHFYTSHPNLLKNGEAVWFEGKRSRNIGIAGLGAESNLFVVSTANRKISELNEYLLKEIGITLGKNVSMPSVSPSETKLIVGRPHFDKDEDPMFTQLLLHIDLSNGNKRVLTDNQRYFPSKLSQIFWSLDENKIVYNVLFNLFYVDIYSGDIHRVPTQGLIETDRHISCSAGSWYDEKSFVLSCTEVNSHSHGFYLYSIDENKFEELAKITKNNFSISSLNISRKKDKILFVGTKRPDEVDRPELWVSEIWLLDIQTGEYYPITDSRRTKGWFRWYENL